MANVVDYGWYLIFKVNTKSKEKWDRDTQLYSHLCTGTHDTYTCNSFPWELIEIITFLFKPLFLSLSLLWVKSCFVSLSSLLFCFIESLFFVAKLNEAWRGKANNEKDKQTKKFGEQRNGYFVLFAFKTKPNATLIN